MARGCTIRGCGLGEWVWFVRLGVWLSRENGCGQDPWNVSQVHSSFSLLLSPSPPLPPPSLSFCPSLLSLLSLPSLPLSPLPSPPHTCRKGSRFPLPLGLTPTASPRVQSSCPSYIATWSTLSTGSSPQTPAGRAWRSFSPDRM